MILFRSYGKTIEITETQRDPSENRRVQSTREKRLFITQRRSDSVRRTRRICLRKLFSAIEELGSPLFLTLTFNGSASDIMLSSKRLTYFLRRLRDDFPDAHALFVPELSPISDKYPAERIHYHGLLFGVSQEWGDIYKGKGKSRKCIYFGRERHERKFQKLWGYGFVDLIQTDGSPRVATYISKYIIKSVEDPFFSPIRLIRSTKNFPNAIEIRGLNIDQLDRAYKFKKLIPSFQSEFYTPFLGNIKKTFYNK
jgi:hypothetical protein